MSIQVVGTGFTVLDRIYADTDALTAEELGGSCGNVLISLAMLQRRVAPVLALGEDDVGDRLVGAFDHAGAETRFIRCRPGRRSPVLAQHLDTISARHRFSQRCPETDETFAGYEPIDRTDVEAAYATIRGCAVFYADRLSPAILEAMELAASGGAVVYFEPSETADLIQFQQALAFTTVLKFSSDRLSALEDVIDIPAAVIQIVTHGHAGLELRQGPVRKWCGPSTAPAVRDTCGAGDMVSVGLIDWLLREQISGRRAATVQSLTAGVRAGQRLAAENCAFIGARGLFRERGADYARTVMKPRWDELFKLLWLPRPKALART